MPISWVMNRYLKTPIFAGTKTMMILVSLFSFRAEAADPLPSEPPPPAEGFLLYKPTSNEKQDTYLYLNKQEDPNLSMNKNAQNYESGKSRAQQMVNMLQNKELTKAFQKITDSSMKTLNENPELKNPLGVIIGAASFWYGQTINLIRNEDVRFSARLEGRERRSEFSMSSPLVNGKLKFDAAEGMGIGFNRTLTKSQTEAAVQYNAKNQVFSTEVRQKLSPNIDLSFGASRLDQNTKIEYRINF